MKMCPMSMPSCEKSCAWYMADRCAVVVIAESMLPQVNIPTVWTDVKPYEQAKTITQRRKRNVKVKV